MLVNPISFRLSLSVFWKTTWSLYKNHQYKYLFHWDLVFFEYLSFFLKKIHYQKKDSDFYISHVRFYRVKKGLVINFYYYFPKEEWMYEDLKECVLTKLENVSKEEEKESKGLKNDARKYYKFWKRQGDSRFLREELIATGKFSFLNKGIIEQLEREEKSKLKNKNYENERVEEINEENEEINEERSKLLLLRKRFEDFYKKNINITKLIAIRNNNNIISQTDNNNFSYTIELYIKKFIFSFKLFFYNIYVYIWSKFLKKEIKKNFKKFFGYLKIDGYKITLKNITARVIVRYLHSTLSHGYNVWHGFRKVVADLNRRVIMQNIGGYKILYCGRFKRALRATYLWRKTGNFTIGSPLHAMDYEVAYHKTKYGVGAIKVWIRPCVKSARYVQKTYPAFNAFFFLDKEKYFYLKKNIFFFNILFKHFYTEYYDFSGKYIKGMIKSILYKYLYTNIFLKKLSISKGQQLNKISKKFRKILIPQYFMYKISSPLFWKIKYLKIKPYIDYNFLKKINIRNSYKLDVICKEKKKWLNKRVNSNRIKYEYQVNIVKN